MVNSWYLAHVGLDFQVTKQAMMQLMTDYNRKCLFTHREMEMHRILNRNQAVAAVVWDFLFTYNYNYALTDEWVGAEQRKFVWVSSILFESVLAD